MEKHSSTGNIYDFNISPQYNQMKERFSINSFKNYNRPNSKKLRLLFTSNLILIDFLHLHLKQLKYLIIL